jgi:hypothetical protein
MEVIIVLYNSSYNSRKNILLKNKKILRMVITLMKLKMMKSINLRVRNQEERPMLLKVGKEVLSNHL